MMFGISVSRIAARFQGLFLRTAGAFIIAVALGLSACGGSENDPASATSAPEREVTNVAKRWLDDLNAGNVEAAQERSVAQTRQLLMSRHLIASTQGKKLAPGKYKILSAELDEYADARIIVDVEKDEEHTHLNIMKLGDEWHVQLLELSTATWIFDPLR